MVFRCVRTLFLPHLISPAAGYWYRLLNTPILRLANWLLIAASLVLLLTGPLGTLKGWKAFAIFFVIAIGVHYRHDLYFYWDEWHVLLRLLEPGKRVFLETHNEHFIPLFLGIFYLESLLFGDNYNLYLLFGLAIHALNGVLTASLIRRLIDSRIGGESAVGARAANSLAVFYLVNALHCSVLEWAFLQAILFCQLLALSAFVNGLDYVREGDRLKLSLCLISAALAPFFFGGGMIIPVQMGLLVLFGVPFLLRKLQRAFGGLALSGDAEEETEDDTKNDAALKRSGYLALMFCFLGVALIAIYAVPREGSGYGVDVPNIAHRFGDLTKLVGYMFVGTQLGSIVRGLGLFPIRELDLTINLIPPEWIQIFDNKFFVFGAIGSFALIAAAGLFLVLRAFSLNPRDTIRILLLGQAFLLSSLFLAALGRSKWGMLFSLAPRYQYSALIGLLICLLPVTLWLLSTHAGTHSVLRKMLLGTFVGCLMLQLYWGARYQLFVEYAQMNRGFVEQLSEWHGLVQRNAPENRQAPYDRAGTPFTGLAPGIPWRLAPNFHPDQVSAVVEALRRRETITAIPDYDS